MKTFIIYIFYTLWGISVLIAQEKEEIVKNHFKGTRLINNQSANVTEKGTLLLLIQHRFGDISEGSYDLFGLDEANMRLGFEYGITNQFNIGIGRSSWLKTYDIFIKYSLLKQTNHFPFSATVSAGGSLPTIKNYYPEAKNQFSDKVSPNIQLHLSKTLKILSFQISPGYIKTGYLTEYNKNLSFFTLGTGASVAISNSVSMNFEYLIPFENTIHGESPLSLGVDIDTGGHLFQILISNNQRMFHNAIYTDRKGNLSDGILFIGFNLIRKFDLNKH